MFGIISNPLITLTALAFILMIDWILKDNLNLLCAVFFYSIFTVPNPGPYHSIYLLDIGVKISIIEALLLFNLALSVARAAFTGDLVFTIKRGRYWLPVKLFSLGLIAGILVGLFKGASPGAAILEVRHLFYLPISYLLTINLIRNYSDIKKIIWAFILGVFVYCLRGLLSHGGHLLRGGSINEPIDPYHSSLMLAFALFILLTLYFLKDRQLVPRSFQLVLIILCLYNLLFNYRRAIYLGFAIGLVILLTTLAIRYKNLFKPLLVLILILFALSLYLGPGVLSSVSERALSIGELEYYGQEGAAGSNFYRLWEMANFVKNIKNAPILGLGAGHEWNVYIPFYPKRLTKNHFHNTHAALWLKYGIYTLVAFIALLLFLTWDSIRKASKESDPFFISLYLAAACYSVCFLIASLFGDYMYYIRPPFWMGIIIGITSALIEVRKESPELVAK
ncbi:MAG: hypothetical protein GF315_08255 [candidate division Zixibacteria bacterium]|nr:hypothetical protein [candidate division Zixibacteria bacterium]